MWERAGEQCRLLGGPFINSSQIFYRLLARLEAETNIQELICGDEFLIYFTVGGFRSSIQAGPGGTHL